MSISSVRFAGLKDFIAPHEGGKEHVPYVKSVYALKPAAIKTAKSCAQGVKVQLQDDSFAYVHPYHANVEYRIGAHKLAKLLQFDISPKVKAIAIPEALQHEKPRPTSPFGTIVDWLEGPTFKSFSGMSGPHRKKFDQANLTELYFFHLISQDSDFHYRNIIVKVPNDNEQEKPVKLFAIDNEKTGADPKEFIAKMNKYPDELRRRVEGKPIPPEILAKLKHFIETKATGAKKLHIYFPDDRVENSYKIAEFLLNHKSKVKVRTNTKALVEVEMPTVPTQEEIKKFLNSLEQQDKDAPTLPQPQSQQPSIQEQPSQPSGTPSTTIHSISNMVGGIIKDLLSRIETK